MATALCAIVQLNTCLLDCADTSDFMRRREIAVGDFADNERKGSRAWALSTKGTLPS